MFVQSSVPAFRIDHFNFPVNIDHISQMTTDNHISGTPHSENIYLIRFHAIVDRRLVSLWEWKYRNKDDRDKDYERIISEANSTATAPIHKRHIGMR